MTETVFRNGRIVLPDSIHEGDLVIRDGLVVALEDAGLGRSGADLDGDWLLPGLVELHTDHLEGHYAPRPRVRWNPVAAVQAHDAQIASSGITTVFDALRVGMDEDSTLGATDMQALAGAIAESQEQGRLRAEHFIHLRCEVAAPDVMESFVAFENEPLVRIASLMDHTPGQRQFTSIDAYRAFYQGKSGMSDEALQALFSQRQRQSEAPAARNRQAIAAMCNHRGIALASHDDATADHVAEAVAIGVTVAEFPTTQEAASASHAAGLKVLMGAPNIVRGGSHSGNIAARDLARSGILDILSSDYFPLSLLHAAFVTAGGDDGISLAQAVAMVSLNPARAAGLDDRGAIVPGKRADLVQVSMRDAVPIVRAVWREGVRVV